MSTSSSLRPRCALGRGIRARDQVAVVGLMREARPHLLPVDHERVPVVDGAGRERREVRPGTRLAHAETEHQFAAHDPRDDLALLLLGAVREERGTDLAIADPMGRGRRARPQQLLGHDRALDVVACRAAVGASARSCR